MLTSFVLLTRHFITFVSIETPYPFQTSPPIILLLHNKIRPYISIDISGLYRLYKTVYIEPRLYI